MNSPITSQSTVAALADHWLQQLRVEERLDRTTINEYERVLRNLVIPTLGGITLHELTTDRINGVLADLGAQSLDCQRKAKVVMGAMLDKAVEHEALSRNPVRGSLSLRRPAPVHRSLTAKELETVRAAVHAGLRKERSGPKSSGDIADIIEVMLAIGARIGEVLALRWADIDLCARVVEINATIKTESGVGTYRKTLPHPRMVALPEAALLLQRRRSVPDNFLDAVFPTRNVTWQQVNNVERRWRQIRSEAGLEWVNPEVFPAVLRNLRPGRICVGERYATASSSLSRSTAASSSSSRSAGRFARSEPSGSAGRNVRSRCDLSDPEPELTADTESAGAATLAAQVVEGLEADAELRGELRQGDDGAEAGLGVRCGLHADQVRKACRARPRAAQTNR